MNQNRKVIYLILLAGLLARLFLFFNFLDSQEFFYDDDSFGYVQLAENMRVNKIFSWEADEPFVPNSFRTPGYPFFLFLHKAIFGNYLAALVVQSILVVASAYILFLLAEISGKKRIGELAAAIFLFMPFSLQVSLQFLTQPLFLFTLMLAVWFWVLFLKTNQNKFFLYVSFLLPVLALIRPIAVFIYIPFLISFFYNQRFLNKKLFLYKSFGLIFIFFLILLPWMIRNYRLFGEFSLSSIGPYQLYFYDAPAVYSFNHDLSFAQAREFLENKMNEQTQIVSFDEYFTYFHSDILKQRAKEVFFESPLGLLATRGILGFKFFVRDGIRYWLEQDEFSLILIERISLFVIFAGMIFYLSSFFRRNSQDKELILFFALLIFYFAALSGAVSSAGLRFVVEPLFILTGLLGFKNGLDLVNPHTHT
ncbi:MAG: glycosyltransferase family 39 protein [Patescibacteria group bacterium]